VAETSGRGHAARPLPSALSQRFLSLLRDYIAWLTLGVAVLGAVRAAVL